METPENLDALTSSTSAAEAIRRGRASRKQGNLEVARRYFATAVDIAPKNPVAGVEMAATLCDLERLDEAEACYRTVLVHAPAHVGALTGLARLAEHRGNKQAALDWLIRAASIDPDNQALLMQIGRGLQALGKDHEAESWFRLVLERMPDHAGALIRLAEIARHRGEPTAALALYERAGAGDGGSRALRLGMARTLCELGRCDQAEAAFRSLLEASSDFVPALIGLVDVARQRGDLTAALALCQAAAEAAKNHRDWFLVVGGWHSLCRFEEAGSILDRIAASAGPDVSELRARQFEHFCLTLRFADAEKLLRAWHNHARVPQRAVRLTVELYAALGRWSDLLTFFRERVVEAGWHGRYDRMVEPLLRAARATGDYGQAFELLGRLPDAASSALLRSARDHIVEEVRLLQLLAPRQRRDAKALDQPIADSFRRDRSNLFGRALQRRQGPPTIDIFMCVDGAYLVGAAVCLFSLMKYNLESLRDWRLTVFCSDDIFALGADVFGRLGDAFTAPVTVCPSSSLGTSDTVLRTGWGYFTAGYALSRAAYYRIYAARKLAEEGEAHRALYIDSDVCVYSGLDRLIGFDLAGEPLAARLEDHANPLIRRAATLLGIEPERYFNSGVLVFDPRHPELRRCLDRAAEICLTDQRRLSFVDQCALNLAFRGRFAILPERFNRFVKPDAVLEASPEAPVIRHFLARPKPWDPLYATTNCQPWLTEFAGMTHLLAPDLTKQLLSLNYRMLTEVAPVPLGTADN